jgi:hypothetical protein
VSTPQFKGQRSQFFFNAKVLKHFCNGQYLDKVLFRAAFLAIAQNTLLFTTNLSKSQQSANQAENLQHCICK